MDAATTLAERIAILLADLGISGRQLAAKAGLKSAAHVNLLKRSAHRANPETLAKIATAGNVSVEWLTYGRGPMRPPTRSVELDGDIDPLIARVGQAIGADPRDIRIASDVRAASGTGDLTEAAAKELLEGTMRVRREHERAMQLAELEAAAGVKRIVRVAPVVVADDDPDFGPKGPRRGAR